MNLETIQECSFLIFYCCQSYRRRCNCCDWTEEAAYVMQSSPPRSSDQGHQPQMWLEVVQAPTPETKSSAKFTIDRDSQTYNAQSPTMPSEVSDIKQFIEICRRKDASCKNIPSPSHSASYNFNPRARMNWWLIANILPAITQ